MPGREAVIAKLKQHARRAAGYSHSPYSHFPVGAAVVSESGEIFQGCNVENASFGLTQCAERSALITAIGAGESPGSLAALLLYTPGNTAHRPCGACRQVIIELMAMDCMVVSCCDGSETRLWTRTGLLTDPFLPEVLLKE